MVSGVCPQVCALRNVPTGVCSQVCVTKHKERARGLVEDFINERDLPVTEKRAPGQQVNLQTEEGPRLPRGRAQGCIGIGEQ